MVSRGDSEAILEDMADKKEVVEVTPENIAHTQVAASIEPDTRGCDTWDEWVLMQLCKLMHWFVQKITGNNYPS